MRLSSLLFGSVLAWVFVASPLSAQITANPNDPLARRGAAPPQACSATEASSAEAAAKIIPQVMGPSPMEGNLRRLTDEVGGRVTGSPAMARAVDWAVAAFRDAGVDDVHTEKYTIPATWSEGDSHIQVISPAAFPVRMVSVAWSPATPPGGIEADVIDAG